MRSPIHIKFEVHLIHYTDLYFCSANNTFQNMPVCNYVTLISVCRTQTASC